MHFNYDAIITILGMFAYGLYYTWKKAEVKGFNDGVELATDMTLYELEENGIIRVDENGEIFPARENPHKQD